MTGLIIAIHVGACALLITIILIQTGRGGGLIDTFSGVESMFGTKTSAFLTRATAVLAVVFFITCLVLALLSARQSRSLLKGWKTPGVESSTAPAASSIPVQPVSDKPSSPAPAAADKAGSEAAVNE